ncbi:MAG: YIP1 family protein [Acidobacteriaceae bacterium]|nr:YIP1 family protein [Acidobacteriaceae bacterium]MBV9780740.1 YIP1 family protein [Acidobacteriaceae bacterium]
MARAASGLPAETHETFADNLAGMGSFYIDPQGAAARVFHKWFWVGPLVVFSIVSVIATYLMIPMVQHVLEVAPMPPNVSPDQYQRGASMAMTMMRVSMYFSPVVTAVLLVLPALILYATCSVLTIDVKFRWLVNLVAGCSLIQVVAAIAAIVILKAKGEVSTQAELHPALGLDIFLPEGTSKYLMALAGYFSIFEIWWIIMMVLIFSTAFRVSKGKAFAAILPLVILSILFRVGAAAFQR